MDCCAAAAAAITLTTLRILLRAISHGIHSLHSKMARSGFRYWGQRGVRTGEGPADSN